MTANGSSTYYRGGVMVYNGDELAYMFHPDGVVRKTNSSYIYQYNLPDHVGSTRVVLAANPGNNTLNSVPEQTTGYYPFGSVWGAYDNLGANKYLFGGKELQDGTVNGKPVELYDFHARFYDPYIARWSVQDPMGQFASPYTYCGNNPVNFIDPTGMWSGGRDIVGMGDGGGNWIDPIYSFTERSGDGVWHLINTGGEYESPYADYFGNQRYLDDSGYSESVPGSSFDWQSLIPVWGSTKLGDQALAVGNYYYAVGHYAFALADGLSLGTLALLRNALKTAAIRTATTQAAKNAVTNTVPKGKLANHLFKGVGKLADNPTNRALIQKISNGQPLGVDPYGKSWYMGADAAGNAVYSYTQNGVVKGAGYATMSAEEIIIKYRNDTDDTRELSEQIQLLQGY